MSLLYIDTHILFYLYSVVRRCSLLVAKSRLLASANSFYCVCMRIWKHVTCIYNMWASASVTAFLLVCMDGMNIAGIVAIH